MSILAVLEQEAIDILKAAGHAIEQFFIGEAQKLVAEVKQTNLGTLALNLVGAIESHDMTGQQKLASVVGALIPALEALQAGGGLPGLAGSIKDFAIEFAQSAYNDFKKTVAAS